MRYFHASRLWLVFVTLLFGGLNSSLTQPAGTTASIGATGAAVGQISRLVEAFGVRHPGIVVVSLTNLVSGRYTLFNEQVLILCQVSSALVARSIAFVGSEPGRFSRTSRFSASLGI